MAQFSMVMLYTRLDEGQELRQVSPELMSMVRKDYYDMLYHTRFIHAVEQALSGHGEVLVLDCHSYREVIKKQPRPELTLAQTLIIKRGTESRYKYHDSKQRGHFGVSVRGN